MFTFNGGGGGQGGSWGSAGPSANGSNGNTSISNGTFIQTSGRFFGSMGGADGNSQTISSYGAGGIGAPATGDGTSGVKGAIIIMENTGS